MVLLLEDARLASMEGREELLLAEDIPVGGAPAPAVAPPPPPVLFSFRLLLLVWLRASVLEEKVRVGWAAPAGEEESGWSPVPLVSWNQEKWHLRILHKVHP